MYKRLNSTGTLIQKTNHGGSSMDSMYYIGLDVHKKTISYCIKKASGQIHREGWPGISRSTGSDPRNHGRSISDTVTENFLFYFHLAFNEPTTSSQTSWGSFTE